MCCALRAATSIPDRPSPDAKGFRGQHEVLVRGPHNVYKLREVAIMNHRFD